MMSLGPYPLVSLLEARQARNKNKQLLFKGINPKQIKEGYFLESGWASADNLKVPDNNSLWKIKQNKVLTSKTPIELEWDNQNGLIFLKKIELDDQYLFKITESVKNNTNTPLNLFHYSQITRKEKPEVQNFYILHEGLVGVIDENLQEQKYDDIKEKNQKYSWLCFSCSAILPHLQK